jgi:outer membrane protein W
MTRVSKLVVALSLLAAASAARAQAENYQPVRVDTTFFAAYAPADAASWGIGVAVEPKFNVTDHLSAGLRLEGSGMLSQNVKTGPAGSSQASVSQGARAVTGIGAKGDWYFTTSSVRPFVGLGFGWYKVGEGSQSVSTGAGAATVVQSAGAYSGLGMAPQIGVNFGGFRLAATYTQLLGGDRVLVTQTVGSPAVETKLATAFWAFEIGGTFGGNRRESTAPVAAPAAAPQAPVR